MKTKYKGYRIERKLKQSLEREGWVVVRAGGSFGKADLVCIKKGVCVFFQVKSTRRDRIYYKGYMGKTLEGFPFYIVVDFGYGNIEVFEPASILKKGEGEKFEEFIRRFC